jgi:hypothetical protein
MRKIFLNSVIFLLSLNSYCQQSNYKNLKGLWEGYETNNKKISIRIVESSFIVTYDNIKSEAVKEYFALDSLSTPAILMIYRKSHFNNADHNIDSIYYQVNFKGKDSLYLTWIKQENKNMVTWRFPILTRKN